MTPYENLSGPIPLDGQMPPTDRSSSEISDDAFNPGSLRLGQDFESHVGVRKAINTVPVRKPDSQWFVRVRAGNEFHLATAVLEVKEDRETYLVEPSLWSELPGEIVPKMLFTAIN